MNERSFEPLVFLQFVVCVVALVSCGQASRQADWSLIGHHLSKRTR